MNAILAGIVAAVPVGAILALFIYLRGDRVVAAMGQDPPFDGMPESQARWIWVAIFGLTPLLLGVVAGIVFGIVSSRWNWGMLEFLALAVGLAALLSIGAVVSRTPLALEKIGANFAVAIGLGGLIPLLAG